MDTRLTVLSSCNGIQVQTCGELITTARVWGSEGVWRWKGASGPPSKLHRISCACSNLCFKWSCEISVLQAGHIWIICRGIAEICFWRRGDGIVCTRQGPRGAERRTRRHMRARQLQSSFCDMKVKICFWQTLCFFVRFVNFMHLHKWFISFYRCEK